MQGSYCISMKYMIEQFGSMKDIKYCISTYENVYIQRIENKNVIYSSSFIIPDNDITKLIKGFCGEGIYCQQIYSTLNGL